jgi:hypothetical protein
MLFESAMTCRCICVLDCEPEAVRQVDARESWGLSARQGPLGAQARMVPCGEFASAFGHGRGVQPSSIEADVWVDRSKGHLEVNSSVECQLLTRVHMGVPYASQHRPDNTRHAIHGISTP